MIPTKPSSQISPEHDSSSLRVSLSGQQDSMTDALDEAVAKLNTVTDAELPSSSEPSADDQTVRKGLPQDSTPLFQLIENMSAAPCRRDAVAQMVELLTSQCGGCHVRCGLGKARLTHFYDSRLGWLGPAEFTLSTGVRGLGIARAKGRRSGPRRRILRTPRQDN